jgi:hypothetical protein
MKDHWNMDPRRQQEHNRTISSMLNTGNLGMPTAFPAIGKKTGLAIYYHQERHNGINSIQGLKNIEGLTIKFYTIYSVSPFCF